MLRRGAAHSAENSEALCHEEVRDEEFMRGTLHFLEHDQRLGHQRLVAREPLERNRRVEDDQERRFRSRSSVVFPEGALKRKARILRTISSLFSSASRSAKRFSKSSRLIKTAAGRRLLSMMTGSPPFSSCLRTFPTDCRISTALTRFMSPNMTLRDQ